MMDDAPQTLGVQGEPDLSLRFPPLPRTVTEVSILMAEEADVPDTPRLVELTHSDPALAMTVLRRINSAYYGMPRRVSEVRQAVFLLGFNEVCNLVLTSALLELRSILRSPAQEKIFYRVMRQSLGTAFLAQTAAFHYDVPRKATAFTLGLLHLVGRLVFLYNMPAEYEALWLTGDPEEGPTPKDEKGLFGYDHRMLTVWACEAWNLPDTVTTVLQGTYDPRVLVLEEQQTLVHVLAASAAANRLFTAPETAAPAREEAFGAAAAGLAERVDVTPEMVTDLYATHKNEALRYIAAMEA